MGDDISISTGREPGCGISPKPSVHPARPDKLALISGIIIAGVVLAGLVVLLAAVKRGLDLTDESDYIQSEMHAGAYLRASTEFQLLLGPVLSLVRHVWLLRAVKLVGPRRRARVLRVVLPQDRTDADRRAIQATRTGIAVGAAIVAGAFGVSRVLPQTPGYNDSRSSSS